MANVNIAGTKSRVYGLRRDYDTQRFFEKIYAVFTRLTVY